MTADKEALKNEILQLVDDIAAAAVECRWQQYYEDYAQLAETLDKLLEPEDALEQACIDIAALVEDRGKLLTVRPTKLILIPDEPKE